MENIPIIAIGTYFEKWYVKDYAAFLSERNKLKIVLSVSTDWKAVFYAGLHIRQDAWRDSILKFYRKKLLFEQLLKIEWY